MKYFKFCLHEIVAKLTELHCSSKYPRMYILINKNKIKVEIYKDKHAVYTIRIQVWSAVGRLRFEKSANNIQIQASILRLIFVSIINNRYVDFYVNSSSSRLRDTRRAKKICFFVTCSFVCWTYGVADIDHVFVTNKCFH